MNEYFFDHERLKVYQESLLFIKWVEDNTKHIPKNIPAKKHLDEAATSISLNIAEGNGKFTVKDKCKFFDISKGPALECASCLDILAIKELLNNPDSGKTTIKNIFSMLIGLIKSKSDTRVYDDLTEYKIDL
jgi:four helix bundle protein